MSLTIKPLTPNPWPMKVGALADISTLPTVEGGTILVGAEFKAILPRGYIEIAGTFRGLEISCDGINYFPVRKGDVLPIDTDGVVYFARTIASGSGASATGTFRYYVWPESSAGLRAALGRVQPAGVVPSYGNSIQEDCKIATIAAGVAASLTIVTAGIYLVTVKGADVFSEGGAWYPNGYAAHEYKPAGTYIFDTSGTDSAVVSMKRPLEWVEVPL